MGIYLKIYFGSTPYNCNVSANSENLLNTGWPSENMRHILKENAINKDHISGPNDTEYSYVFKFPVFLRVMAKMWENDDEMNTEEDGEESNKSMVKSIFYHAKDSFDDYILLQWE